MLKAEFYYTESSKLPEVVNYPENLGLLMRDGEKPLKCILTGGASGISPRGLGKWTKALENALRPGGDMVINTEAQLVLSEGISVDSVSDNLNVYGPSSAEVLGDSHEALTFGPLPAGITEVLSTPGPLSDNALENPKKAAGAVKAPFHATPELGLIQMENVMAGGGYKYGDFNYHDSKVDAKTYMSAMRRHYLLWKDGVDMDEESMQNHLAHVMACCAIMIEAQETGMFIDNRPKTGLVAEALRKSSSTFEAYRTEHDRKMSSPENSSS